MRRLCRVAGMWFAALFCLHCAGDLARAEAPAFTLQQALSAPYATDLTAAPVGGRYAWVEDAEGRHNLWVGGPEVSARALTANTEDDAQDIAEPAWSPDAHLLAYTFGAETGQDGKPANPAHLQRPAADVVMLVNTEGVPMPRAVGEGHAPLFTRDGRGLLFLRGGQIWIADLTGSNEPVRPLVFDRGSASQLTLSQDGRFLAFVSTRREAGQAHSFIALFGVEHRHLTFVAPSTGNDSAPAFLADGHTLAWLRAPATDTPEYMPRRVSPEPWSIQAADVAACSGIDAVPKEQCGLKSVTIFQPPANKPGSWLPHFATGGARLFPLADGRLVFASEADGWVHLYALDWQRQAAPVLLTPGPYEVQDVSLAAGGTALLYAANDSSSDPLDSDRSHIYKLQLAGVSAGSRPQMLTHGSGIELHPVSAGQSLAVLSSSVSLPMHPSIVAEDGSLHPLHPGSLPAGYPGSLFVTPTPVLLHTRDGLTLHAQLFEPHAGASAAGKRAALLFFHGGPNRQMLLGFPPLDYYSNAYAMNQYLCSRGFVVLSVNYRGGIGYGLNFRERDRFGPEGASEYRDVLTAAQWLRAQANVDPKRIGIWGGSYGGYLTALALARNSDLFAAGVDFHGVHEWSPTVNEPEPWLRGTLATQQARAALAHQSSPMSEIAHWKSPVLLIHGDDDGHVSYNQTPMLADALRARGVPVEELVFPDETHGFLLHSDWLRAYQATAEFFERTLHPER